MGFLTPPPHPLAVSCPFYQLVRQTWGEIQGEDRQCDVYGVDRWGRGDVSDDDYESSDSEAESEMGSSMMGGGELIDDEDRKTNIFVGEITESLQRGIEEGVDANNLVLEINSSRFVRSIIDLQFYSGLAKI